MPKPYTKKIETTLTEGLKNQFGTWTTGPRVVTREESGSKLAVLLDTDNGTARPWSNYSIVKTVTTGSMLRTDYWNTYPSGTPPQYIRYYRGFLTSDNPYKVDDTIAFLSSVESEAQVGALGKLISALNSEKAQWSLATSLGEARETASHIGSTARRIAAGALALRRGKFSEALRHLKGSPEGKGKRRKDSSPLSADDFSSAWLEYSYAWIPLLGDIDSAAKYLAEKRLKSGPRRKTIGRRHTAEGLTFTDIGTGLNARWREQRSDVSIVKYTYDVSPNFSRNFETLEELGFTDPFGVAWDLLPLSFVVDWFLNVGQVLESLHTFSQWKVHRGLVSTRNTLWRMRYMTQNATNVDGNGDIAVIVSGAYAPTFRRDWSKRLVTSNFPTSIPLRFKVDNPFDLNGQQMASAVALLQKAFH
jgi:hypothetical protein